MSRKSRLLRILLTILAVVLFAGYFAFSTFFFSPFESGLGVDVSALVDDRVDFFVARARLGEEFDSFPRLAVMDELEAHPAWETWADSPECETLSASLGYDELMQRIEAELEQLPAGVDLLSVFGGRDLALAGYLRPGGLEQAEWAAYGTLSTTGKLAISLLSYPGLIGLDAQGIQTTENEGYVTLSGGPLQAPLHVARILDAGVVSSSAELVVRAIDLEARQFEGSFFAGATYHDRIRMADRNDAADEIELFVNSRALMETLQLTGAWPDPNSPDLLPSLASKFFQVGALNRLVGILGIDDGLSLDLHAKLSSELMTPLQMRTYKKRAVSGEDLVDKYAVFAPKDVSLFLYFKCDMGDLLHQVFNSMEPATRSLVEERFQATGKYRDLGELIDEVDSALLDHCILMIRENDYPDDPTGPPHNDEPVPAVAFVAFLAEGGGEKIDELRHTIGMMGASIGLQGREPGTSGFYSNKVGGYSFNEYWTPHVDGTGVIAAGTTQEVVTVTNSILMYNHVRKTFTQGAPTHPRLSERPDFAALARSSEKGANLAVWLNPRASLPTLRKSVQRWAEDGIEIDWGYERARVEDKILREDYAGKQRQELSPMEAGDFEKAVDARIEEIDQEIRRTQIPALVDGYERKLAYLGAVRAGLLTIAADDRSLDVALRLVVPLEE